MNQYKMIFLIIFLISVLNAQEKKTQAEPDRPEDAEPVAIPLTEITSGADEITTELENLLNDLNPPADIAKIETDLPVMLDSLKRMRNKDIFKNLSDLELRILKSLDQEWKLYNDNLFNWRDVLQTRSQNLEKKINRLKELAEIWQLTQKAAVQNKAPQAIQTRITEILKQIKSIEEDVSKRLNYLLIQQNNISQEQKEIKKLITDIDTAEEEVRGQLFVQDSPPLWEAFKTREDSLHIASQFQESWSEMIRSNIAFVSANQDRFYIHLFVFFILFAFTMYLSAKNRREQLFDADDNVLKHSAVFVSRPVSAALLIALILSIWIYPDRSATVGEFIMLLLLIPLLRLIPGILPTGLRKPVYILAFLFVVDLLQKNAVGFVFLQRILLLISTITAIAVLVWLLRPAGLIRKYRTNSQLNFLRRLAPVVLLLLVVAFAANLYGSIALAATVTWGIVESSHILVTVYIAASVVSGLITVVIRRRRIQVMQFVKAYAHNIERWARFTISTIAVLIWLRLTLRFFGFLEPLKKWYLEILETKWTVGAVVISLDAIIDFILILIGTFLFTRLVRIFMDMEIFPRIKLPQGLPAALTMVVRYSLIGLGIFLALSSLGIDLGKFGVLAGALGVGLGFGLQKIVANFISSLILAFGRTIRVGDTVQYNDVFGSIQEIGVNASTVKTFDGSDVIIPNADLISNKVTNWTLTDVKRRMQLPVKVAYGNDPHLVLQLLEKAANEHPDVLETPNPFAVFNGFGDNFLDFTLYYWIPGSLFFKAKTEVALAVHDTIKMAGINTPRPQRDIDVRVLPEEIKKKVVSKASANPKSPTPKNSRQSSSGKTSRNK